MISGEFTMTELENKATDNGKKTAVKPAAAHKPNGPSPSKVAGFLV